MTRPRPPRHFYAEDVLAGRVSLDGYPFRHVALTVRPGSVLTGALKLGSGFNDNVDVLLSAVEWLEPRGWELVSVDQVTIAYLRRRA
jgi:hypothetical protein